MQQPTGSKKLFLTAALGMLAMYNDTSMTRTFVITAPDAPDPQLHDTKVRHQTPLADNRAADQAQWNAEVEKHKVLKKARRKII